MQSKEFFFPISHLQSRGYFFFFSEGRGGLHPLETSSMPSTAASLVFIFSVCSHWSMRKSVVMQRFVSLSEIIGKKKKNRNISHCIGTAPSCVEKRPSTFFFLWFHPQCLRIFRPRHRVHNSTYSEKNFSQRQWPTEKSDFLLLRREKLKTSFITAFLVLGRDRKSKKIH